MYQDKLQLVNPRVKLEQIVNQSQEMHPKAHQLAQAIIVYICEQRILNAKHIDSYDAQALIRNQINLSKKGHIFNDLYPTINNKYEKNKIFKKAVEELIDKNVILAIDGPFEKNTHYLLNPLYYYDGYSFLNVYLHWCYLAQEEVKSKYVEDCIPLLSYNTVDEFEDLDVSELNSMVSKGLYEY